MNLEERMLVKFLKSGKIGNLRPPYSLDSFSNLTMQKYEVYYSDEVILENGNMEITALNQKILSIKFLDIRDFPTPDWVNTLGVAWYSYLQNLKISKLCDLIRDNKIRARRIMFIDDSQSIVLPDIRMSIIFSEDRVESVYLIYSGLNTRISLFEVLNIENIYERIGTHR